MPNSGFVGTVNLAFDACSPHDVVVVNSDVVVPAEWLGRLRTAAYARSTVATATPFTNNGGILSVPYRNLPKPALENGLTTEQEDERIRVMSLKLRPLIPTAIGHCTYFRRAALNIVGYFDEAFAPGYDEEVDFCQRANALGFTHVVADDVFVYHKGSQSFGKLNPDSVQRIRDKHEQIIAKRYPWYHRWVRETETDTQSPLALALERARAALLGYRIAVDATCINGVTTGTQVLTLELIQALAEAREIDCHLAIIINDIVPMSAFYGLDKKVDEVIRLSSLRYITEPLFDLVHRPYQVTSDSDLKVLQKVASRFVVTHLDNISYLNAAYYATTEGWESYRRLTRLVFDSADGIMFISHDAALDAQHLGLTIPETRSCVAYPGVDHTLHMPAGAMAPNSDVQKLGDQPFILVIGTNFKHKNRPYAIRLFRELATTYHWSGTLVFAGPSVVCGGSSAEEATEISQSGTLSSRILLFGAVNEDEKHWLLQHAALVLYPTNYEGFGFVPFEAAAAGAPAISSPGTSLGEVLGQGLLYLDLTNIDLAAESVWKILSDPAVAASQVQAIRTRAEAYTWRKAAVATWGFYRDILALPVRYHGTPRTPSRIWSKNPQFAMETSVHTWVKRLAKGIRILGNEGGQPLVSEIKQYLKWRFG
jgi:glycosyltransferase involved in cell wall biosynthesis/GT2 family glycosyltransferase